MIELYSDVQKRNKAFHLNLVASVGRDLFLDSAKEQLEGYAYGPDSINELFTEYLEAPKRLGAVDDDSLAILTLRALSYAQTNNPPKDIKSDMFEIAASSAWEAAFIQTQSSHNSINTVDDRLEFIDVYARMNKAAQSLREPGSHEYHRLALRGIFTPVLQDVACGEITTDTVEDIRASLAEELDNVRFVKDRGNAEGLVGEIKVLQHYWQQYQKIGDLVAVPSTVRGGSGHYRPDETHDIDLIKQRKDRSWIVAPTVEVKKREIRTDDLRRYARSLLAYVAPDGTVSFTSSHRKLRQSGDTIAS